MRTTVPAGDEDAVKTEVDEQVGAALLAALAALKAASQQELDEAAAMARQTEEAA